MPDSFRHISTVTEPSSAPVATTCPVCGSAEPLRVTRNSTGRTFRCRSAERGECAWPGLERPFRRAPVQHRSPAFSERLVRIAVRLVTDCSTNGDTVARIDPILADDLRAAVRQVARDRGIRVRTSHDGHGRVEVRTA